MDPTSLGRAAFVRLGTGAFALAPAVARAAMPDAAPHGLDRIARIHIVHLPASITTRSRLTAAQLAASPDTRRLTIEDPPSVARVAGAARAIVAARKASFGGYDCRWSFRFEATNGSPRTLTCDSFGRAGAIDGHDVTLDAAEFLASIERSFPILR